MIALHLTDLMLTEELMTKRANEVRHLLKQVVQGVEGPDAYVFNEVFRPAEPGQLNGFGVEG